MTDKEKADKYKESYDLLLIDFNTQNETIAQLELKNCQLETIRQALIMERDIQTAKIEKLKQELETITCDCIKIFDIIHKYIRLKGA